MFGLLLGLACGGTELLLLLKLTRSVCEKQKVPLWILPAKMAAPALFLVPCGFFFPGQLVYAGIGAAGVLIIGAVLRFLLPSHKRKEGRT